MATDLDQRPATPAGAPGGRRWLAPVVVIVGFLLVGGYLGGVGGRLSEVQHNDAAAYLPGSSDAAAVLAESKRFTGLESTPAVLVYTREGGVTEDDRRRIVLALLHITSQASMILAGPPRGPILSDDGAAAEVIVPFIGSDPDQIRPAVDWLRAGIADVDGPHPARGRAGRGPDRPDRGLRRDQRRPAAGHGPGRAADPRRSSTAVPCCRSWCSACAGHRPRARRTASPTCWPGRRSSRSPARCRASSTCWCSAPARTTRCMLVARFREELRRHEDVRARHARAWRAVGRADRRQRWHGHRSACSACSCPTCRRRRARPGRRARHRVRARSRCWCCCRRPWCCWAGAAFWPFRPTRRRPADDRAGRRAGGRVADAARPATASGVDGHRAGARRARHRGVRLRGRRRAAQRVVPGPGGLGRRRRRC